MKLYVQVLLAKLVPVYLPKHPHFQNLTLARTDTVILLLLTIINCVLLEAEVREYGKGRYISDDCLANQSFQASNSVKVDRMSRTVVLYFPCFPKSCESS